MDLLIARLLSVTVIVAGVAIDAATAQTIRVRPIVLPTPPANPVDPAGNVQPPVEPVPGRPVAPQPSIRLPQIRPRIIPPVTPQPGTAQPGTAQPGTRPPRVVSPGQLQPTATILQPQSSPTQVVQSLAISRTIPLQSIQANPVILSGNVKANFSPVLNNPQALANVADRLKLIPQAVELVATDTKVHEIDRGLVLHSGLKYRIKLGACNDPGRQSQLIAAGVTCFEERSEAQRIAAFGTPGNPRYVADPDQRMQAIADAQAMSAQIKADMDSHIASLRSAMNDPAKRQQLEMAQGKANIAYLAALNDHDLMRELVNSSTQEIDQVMFVPNGNATLTEFSDLPLQTDDPATSIQLKQTIFTGVIAQQAAALSPDQQNNAPFAERIFLTGFTLGKDAEWNFRKQITIDYLVDSVTYYVEASAGFKYGLGLRFPIKMNGAYHYKKVNNQESAYITPQFEPINGDVGQYASTGLVGDKLFDGREFVARFTSNAGFGYKLPSFGKHGVNFSVGKDLTEDLPAPFTNGDFTPPAPGKTLSFDHIFKQVDLIGGRANFGAFGAKVFPAVKIGLHSDALRFTLHDFGNGAETVLNQSGAQQNIFVGATNPASEFAIGDPVYNLGFNITPGIDAHLFVDLYVWDKDWDFPVWFPQLSVQLPTNGVDFSCHTGTSCAQLYRVSAQTGLKQQDESNIAGSGFEKELRQWRDDFANTWVSQCRDEACKKGIDFLSRAALVVASAKHRDDPNLTLAMLKTTVLQNAENEAKAMVAESEARYQKLVAKDFAAVQFALWSGQCADAECIRKLHGILFFELWAMNAEMAKNPGMTAAEAFIKVGPDFAKAAQQEIDASKARATKILLPPGLILPNPGQPVAPPIPTVPPKIRVKVPLN